MSKRLITATAGFAFGALALGLLATAAEARPHEGYYGSRYSSHSYSNDDGGYERKRTYRRHAGKRTGKRYATKSGKGRSYARRGGSSRSAVGRVFARLPDSGGARTARPHRGTVRRHADHLDLPAGCAHCRLGAHLQARQRQRRRLQCRRPQGRGGALADRQPQVGRHHDLQRHEPHPRRHRPPLRVARRWRTELAPVIPERRSATIRDPYPKLLRAAYRVPDAR